MNHKLKNKLVWDAVPTLFTVPNPPAQLGVKRPPPKERIAEHVPTKKKRKTQPESENHENGSVANWIIAKHFDSPRVDLLQI